MKKLLAMIIVSAMMLGIAPLSAFSGISSTSAVIAEAKDSSGNTAMMGDVDCDKSIFCRCAIGSSCFCRIRAVHGFTKRLGRC